MNCNKIIDSIYRGENGDSVDPGFIEGLKIEMHLLFCMDCRERLRRFNLCNKILREDFLPESPDLEDTIMAHIAEEAQVGTRITVTEGFSFRGWSIAGLVLLISLATIFFGMDFNKVALASGTLFVIPVGITVGLALSIYGALFIASHLERLSRKFGLGSPETMELSELDAGMAGRLPGPESEH